MLDIFFEALNYETIEQKKAYEVAGLLGAFRTGLARRRPAGSQSGYGVAMLVPFEPFNELDISTRPF